MTSLIVVRHGYSVANDAHCFAGRLDTPLSDIGKQQAEHVGTYLAANMHIDKIYTSGLTRTIQTAMPTATRLGLPLHSEQGLQEIFAGLWEGIPYKEIKRLFHDDFMTWCHDLPHARCTCGESIRELYHRTKKTVFRLAEENEGKTLLLVTHATPLRAIHAVALGVSPDLFHTVPCHVNASINIFSYEDGVLSLNTNNLVVYPTHLLHSSAYPMPPRLMKASTSHDKHPTLLFEKGFTHDSLSPH